MIHYQYNILKKKNYFSILNFIIYIIKKLVYAF